MQSLRASDQYALVMPPF